MIAATDRNGQPAAAAQAAEHLGRDRIDGDDDVGLDPAISRRTPRDPLHAARACVVRRVGAKLDESQNTASQIHWKR